MNFMKRAGFVLTCATMLAKLVCHPEHRAHTSRNEMHHTRNGHPCGILFAFHCAGFKTPEGKPYNKESLVVVTS